MVVLRIRKPIESALICTTLIKDSHRDASLSLIGPTNKDAEITQEA